MNHEGIGLGLMICKKLVQQNGGEIKAQSKGADQGATFSFTMKMKVDNLLKPKRRKNKRILLSSSSESWCSINLEYQEMA